MFDLLVMSRYSGICLVICILDSEKNKCSNNSRLVKKSLFSILEKAGNPLRTRTKDTIAVKNSSIKGPIEDFYDKQAMELPDKKVHRRTGKRRKINTKPITKMFKDFNRQQWQV